MITVDINLKCDDRDAAADLLRDIATKIELGDFQASCDRQTQERFGGAIFVVDHDI